MKAVTAMCATGASVPAISGGRVQRLARSRGGESAEIQMYLSKLQDLVPYMPKNRKMSKLEVIHHVIDYICELQAKLDTHPMGEPFDPATDIGHPATAALVSPARRPLTPANCMLPAVNAPQQPHSPHRNTHTSPERTSQEDRPFSC